MPKNMDQNHVITIDQEVEIMKTQLKKAPKLLHKSAGNNSCCIFRVPQSLVEINNDAYRPRIVSIGPYHYGNKDLEMIQEHKWRFLNDMITRTSKPLGYFMNIIVSMEDKIRECYSESIDHFARNELAKMMVLDGFFLIELFRKVGKLVSTHGDDPIFRMAWIPSHLMRDILRIENQIPFFVLKELYEASNPADQDRTLQSLILEFFNYMVNRPERVLKKYANHDGQHLLDFFRKSFLNTEDRNSVECERTNFKVNLIQPATKLVIDGVKFKVNHQADSFLDIKFQNGLLSIPQISLDNFYGCFILNSMVFEQCYFHCSQQFTAYLVFMACLMQTSMDVSVLLKNLIVINHSGMDKGTTKLFTDAGKEVTFDIENSYLSGLFMDVNEYCENVWHGTWAEFKQNYFGSPWITISASAAIILLSLAALQTFYTIFPYYHKRD